MNDEDKKSTPLQAAPPESEEQTEEEPVPAMSDALKRDFARIFGGPLD